jgi:hypothetical protein
MGTFAKSDSLRDLVLGLSGLFHIRDYFTVLGTEAGVFVIHSQLFVKPDWTNSRLCLSNLYSLTI